MDWRPLGNMVARVVGRDEDPEVIVLGLAEYEDGTGKALIFMIAPAEEDDQEADTYCVVREDQRGTTYGGVTGCELAPGRLTLRFTEEAAKELGVERVLGIELQVDDDSVELLRSSLREIVGLPVGRGPG
ncbi:Imm10 family immunity protein [Nonomuraea lactucae]|uniref:Imm10 family immunity protein n=1 Tax=Nonomuraea lactucae TaxID=2249762 RepID=UPI0013B41731|nr:Imm10 family immunity protein [Nonomuraea lactucae]